MKKSNKVLILLFLFITIALVCFNVLLNAQLKQGNFKREFKEASFTSVDLKPFRHVVYDGSMFIRNSRKSQTQMNRSVYITTGIPQKYKATMSSSLSPLINYRYAGDTLFISFGDKHKRIGRAEYAPEGGIALQLYAPSLCTITAEKGEVNLMSAEQKESLTFYAKGKERALLLAPRLASLTVRADSGAWIVVSDNSYVDTLSLLLDKDSNIEFNTPAHVGTIHTMQLDSTARISMSGRANNMKEYLQKMQ